MPRRKGAKRALNFGEYAQKGVKHNPKPPTLSSQSQSPPRPQSPAPDSPNSTVSTDSTGSIEFKANLIPSRPPPCELVKRTIPIIEERLNPKRKSGIGHQKPNISLLAFRDVSSVLKLFRTYCNSDMTWVAASVNVSQAKGFGKQHARTLRVWGRACLEDPHFTPHTSYGRNHDPIIKHDDFRRQLEDHLCSVGKYVGTADVIRFTSQEDVQATYGLTRAVSRTTAKRWMHVLDYRWGREPRGMYIDGHEREDVVEYRQKFYIPTWKEMEPRMQSFAAFELKPHMDPILRRLVVWYHDESTFSPEDCRTIIWVPQSATPKPTKKRQGPTLMVSDLVSADHGWLASPDGHNRARELIEIGDNRQGYFNSARVCKQITHACDILDDHYSDKDHLFIFDNSPTHTKHGIGAPSAQGMLKRPSKEGKNFLVSTTDDEGNEIQVPMTGAYFANGEPQDLYFPKGHPLAGQFKGMAEILKEQGWENADEINGKCKKCDNKRTDCCLYRILYNQPDFANPTSILERLVCSRGYGFLMLPKFHPELNAIEQCWGKAKRVFRELPEPKGIQQLRKNVLAALNEVSLEDIRKFCTRSRRICDGYVKGLDGRLSVWAAKRYHGHREYPEKILEEVVDDFGASSS